MEIKMFQRMHAQETGTVRLAVRVLAFLFIFSLVLLVFQENSQAKNWPEKPITIIVPWPAGGPGDLVARVLAPEMSKILDVPVSVVDKPGGAGIIGTLDALKSPPDGYTIFMDAVGTSSVAHAWAENLPFKVENRTFIARLCHTHQFLIVPASSSFKTVEDLVNAIRTNPSSISIGLIGGMTVPDICVAQFRAALIAKGIDVSKTRSVTYKGTGDVLPAIGGGHLSCTFATPASIGPLVSAGKIRAIAIAAKEREKNYPDVPTMTEAGFPSVNMTYWAGLSGPPNLPQNIINTIDNAAKEAQKKPNILVQLEKLGFLPSYLSGTDFKKFVFDEAEAVKGLKLR